MMRRSFRTVVIVVATLQLLAADVAWAQLAPTGPHNAGRASDTGHTSVSGTGGYSTAVPLDVPPARGGLPVPIAVVHGQRGVGAAGLGWDVPLSFVRQDTTIAHRRPAFSPGTAMTAREQVTLSLAGRTALMVKDGSVWRARQDAPDLLLFERQDNTWQAYDGNGNEFTFVAPQKLGGLGLWVLSSARSTVQENRVDLQYEVAEQFGAGWNGISLDLVAIRYNTHPSDPQCTKDEVILGYGTPSPTPISVSFLEAVPVVRMRTLSVINVRQRASCGAAPETVRSYHFAYQTDRDPDTKLPRLVSVQLAGRESTPEATTRLPHGDYGYDTATAPPRADGTPLRLEYVRGADISFPTDLAGTPPISSTYPDTSVTSPVGSNTYASWQNLIDVTGDGRPDLVYRKNDQLWVAMNRPAGGAASSLTAVAPLQLSTAPFTGKPLFSNSSSSARYDYQWTNQENVWRQTVDINGDGRLDIIDATEAPNFWIVYLNTSGTPVTWIRRSIRVEDVRKALRASGHVLATEHVPLARRTSGRDTKGSECFHWNGTAYELDTFGFSFGGHCLGKGTFVPKEYVVGREEKTFTEWELRDINGDGYPEVVFNGSPVGHTYDPPTNPSDEYLHLVPTRVLQPQLGAGNAIYALINVAGVRFDDSALFSARVPIQEGTACGIALWVDYAQPDEQRMLCGLEDVNGDGLGDRIEDTTVWLGIGYSLKASGFTFELPDFIRHANRRDTTCSGAAANYNPFQLTALRDLTGDGRPDFISRQSTGTGWQVSIGSGTGFNPPVPIQLPVSSTGFTISTLQENCLGSFSDTIGGLYDIDADGKPEIVRIFHNPTHLEVYHLAGSEPGNPQAGRLSRLSNGHGAVTTIRYRSAKQDASSNHYVPFPEIVVTAIETTGASGPGGSLTSTGYAYGDAEIAFDPVADAFTMVGYGTTIEVRGVGAREGLAEVAIVTENYRLSQYQMGMSDALNFERYQRAGRVRDVHVLAYNVPRDPWAALASFVPSDARRGGGQHTEWRSRYTPLATSTCGTADCVDIPYPYDWSLSVATNLGHSPGFARGFTYASVHEEWEGTQAPPSTSNLQKRSEIIAVDDDGNVLSAKNENDRIRPDDDVCIETSYAQQTSTNRLLHAPATRRLTDCVPADRVKTLAMDRWEYDALSVGTVQSGRTTGHIYERRATDTGGLLATVREYEASYDAMGSPVFIASAREDGALRTTELVYDAFGLAATRVTVDGSGVDPLVTIVDRDLVTLDSLTTQASGGPAWSRTLDGFGRETRTGVVPVGGVYGVVGTTSYLGFTGGDPLGRRIQRLSLNNPTPLNGVASAQRQEETVYLDELGRTRRSEQNLGASYGGARLVTSLLTYDGLGRITFSADPFPSTQSADTTYGTSYHFNSDGTIRCAVRGNGPQPLTESSNAATELFPTCVTRSFVNNQLRTAVQRPDALLAGSPQAGVSSVSFSSAIGWILSTETTQGSTRLELDQRSYDQFGQLTALSRFGTPSTASLPVQSSFRFDNRGQQISVAEPATATRSFSFTNFGELAATSWTDAGNAMLVNAKYDAFSRMTGTADLINGTAVPETTHEWRYEQATGRLASTHSTLGDIAFNYDGLGRPRARTFTNHRTGMQYVEESSSNLHGQLESLRFLLPDNNNTPEIFDYAYDSAGRLKAITAKETPSYPTAILFHASTMDVFGRVLHATYGNNTTYRSTHRDTGRRLPTNQVVEVASGALRYIEYQGFDPVGRELQRTERNPSGVDVTTTNGYDVLGRISSFVSDSYWDQFVWSAFSYDALGNRRAETNWLTGGTTNVRTEGPDHDRLCRVDYGFSSGTSCDVLHDAAGNVTRMKTLLGTRNLSYFPSGLIRTLDETPTGSTVPRSATFSYDGTGEISEITSNTGIAVDRRFGPIQERSTSSPTTLVLVRHIPGPGGVVATSAGKSGAWVYRFGEERGNRFTANDQVGFVQDVIYDAFGVLTGGIAPPSNPTFMRDQWNGGTALEGFGLVQLGARMYDPRLGRFLSRDPLVIPRTAATTNPYAFAANDPINLSDPSGLDFGTCATSWGGPCGSSPSTGDSVMGSAAFGFGVLAFQYLGGGAGGGSSAAPSFVPKQDTSAVGTSASMWPTFRRPPGVLNYLGRVAVSFGHAATHWYDEAQSFRRDMFTGRLLLRGFDAVGALAYSAMHPVQTAKAIANGVTGRARAIVGGDTDALVQTLIEGGSLVAGGALARGAKALGVAARRGANAYSVAFETRIAKAGAGSRGAHFKAANEALLAEMKANPQLAQAMEGLGVKVPTSSTGAALGKSPGGWTWHHVPDQRGAMQLVPTVQHQGSAWQPLLHPGGVGGFKLWGADF